MEKTYQAPDEVRSKFRSNSDLWKRLSVDRELDWLLINISGCLSVKLFQVINFVYEENYLWGKEVSPFISSPLHLQLMHP